MLAGIQRFFRTAFDIDALAGIGPDVLAREMTDEQIRRQLIDVMVAFSLIDGEVDPAEAALVREYASALEVDDNAVCNIEQLARREVFGLRIDALRRFWAIDELRDRVHDYGLGGVLQFVKANVGRLEDPKLAALFATLRDLPSGTLGREYVRLLDSNAWPLPGEQGALSDVIVFHDMTHVLSGYGTDPVGEIEAACFSAGYSNKEPFTFVLFVLLQFHAGVRMTPGTEAVTGQFDVERALAAIERGSSMTVDLTEGWDYWKVVDVPVAELRRRYGISEPAAAYSPTIAEGTKTTSVELTNPMPS